MEKEYFEVHKKNLSPLEQVQSFYFEKHDLFGVFHLLGSKKESKDLLKQVEDEIYSYWIKKSPEVTLPYTYHKEASLIENFMFNLFHHLNYFFIKRNEEKLLNQKVACSITVGYFDKRKTYIVSSGNAYGVLLRKQEHFLINSPENYQFIDEGLGVFPKNPLGMFKRAYYRHEVISMHPGDEISFFIEKPLFTKANIFKNEEKPHLFLRYN